MMHNKHVQDITLTHIYMLNKKKNYEHNLNLPNSSVQFKSKY